MNRNSLKIALTAILIFCASAMADEEEKPTETKKVDTAAIMKRVYNFRGGINFSSAYNSRSVFGFHVGGMADIPLNLVDLGNEAYLFEFHVGAQFVKKGGKYRYYSLFNGYYSRSFDAYYLEMPVPFSFKKTFSENISARADFGPYIAFGLFGTQKAFDELSRFDAGIIYGTVIDFAKKYSLGAHVGTGLSDDDIYSFYMTLSYKL
ncbi:MAG: PorT family protein [Fibromonadaceae bacterium]|jgi:hypothetical protein|nr:PorT family protein [Fibromonadaceae bacterium]